MIVFNMQKALKY